MSKNGLAGKWARTVSEYPGPVLVHHTVCSKVVAYYGGANDGVLNRTDFDMIRRSLPVPLRSPAGRLQFDVESKSQITSPWMDKQL